MNATRALLTTSLAALCLGASVQAQTLTRSNGVLGASADYVLNGDPGEFWILLPSLNQGPTPLSIFSPGDTRVLEVGLDQIPLWSGGFLDGSGNDSQSYPLPNDASLQGLPVFAQAVTFPGNPFRVDDVFNATGVVFGSSGTSTAPVGQPSDGWTGHTLTDLADGRALRAGGTFVNALGNSIATTGLETWDPQTGEWTTEAGAMSQQRAAHTATRLNDGRVLLAGGGDTNGLITATCDLFDPSTGTVSPTGAMNEARTQHTATLLSDGRVLVVGGTDNFDFSDPLGALASVHASAEVYDPGTGGWTNVGGLPDPRVLHSASLLGDGRVLVTGGIEVTFIFGVPFGAITDDARVFNPATNGFQNVGDFGGERLAHPQLTLSDGRVLVAGGSTGSLLTQVFTPRSDVWVFDPGTDSWSAGPTLGSPRVYGQLVEAGGDVLLLQGLSTIDLTTLSGLPVLDVERTDTSLTPWSIAGTALAGHPLGLATAVDGDARVLTVGDGDDGLTNAELFVR